MPRHTVLLNQVWGLEGCPLKGPPERTNRSVRFDFSVATVLLACRGDQVSFYTTVHGGDVKPFEDGQFRGFSLSKVYIRVYGLFFLSVSVFVDHFYGIKCHSCGRTKN